MLIILHVGVPKQRRNADKGSVRIKTNGLLNIDHRKPHNDDAGYNKPPFVSLLCGKQAENAGHPNRREAYWLSPI